VSPCFSSKSPQKYAKYDPISLTQNIEKTRFVIPKGHFVTPKGCFVMVAPEKGNCWFIFEADKRCNLNFWYWNLKKRKV
jgi:hypothetical protein